jgi:preprotein translocase subunit SecF
MKNPGGGTLTAFVLTLIVCVICGAMMSQPVNAQVLTVYEIKDPGARRLQLR